MSENSRESGDPESGNGGWFERISNLIPSTPNDIQQLRALIRGASKRDIISRDVVAMLEGVLTISEMQVRDIMIPRSQMVVIERDDQPQQILPKIIESAHSRFPVIGESRDEVVGILLAKDMLRHFAQHLENASASFSMSDLLRPAHIVPDIKPLNTLLHEFRSGRNHMAIVADEYGGISGLVTIEDVLEQIVGEIEDEFDIIDEVMGVVKLESGELLIQALTPVEDFNRQFSANFSTSDFDTIGGIIIHRFGHLPEVGEKIILENFEFTVYSADGRRIHQLTVTQVSHPDSD
ncbi:MAG: CBS domain-containing protein [Gammaproteobacteria bacterium]|nr:CBS domain-containing protein [Gammaproteobacteria bacterium]